MSATRDMRRAQRREIRQRLADDGCACRPPIKRDGHDPIIDVIEQLTGRKIRTSYITLHAPWCPGSQAQIAATGVMPIVILDEHKRCQR